MNTAYINSLLFNGEQFEPGWALLVEDNKIADIVMAGRIPSHYEIVNLEGLYLAPALIDLQIYGGNGLLFSQELTVEALSATYEYCLRGGAAFFMITMATNSMEHFYKGIEAVRSYWQQGGAGLLGLHMEGPYLNPVKRGAHIEGYIHQPEAAEIRDLLQAGGDVIKMMTIAPECCSREVIDTLQQAGIILSAGHSNAGYAEAMAAFDEGIPTATHLYNAMSPLQHRAPGLVGALFNHPYAMSSLVCDGIHVDYAAVKIAKKQMGQRLFYITDAVTSCSEGAYQHVLNGDHYTLPNGTLSGSALTMWQSVLNGVRKAGIGLEESLRMASAYPATLLGHNAGMGRLAAGYRAAFIVFDQQLNLHKTIVH